MIGSSISRKLLGTHLVITVKKMAAAFSAMNIIVRTLLSVSYRIFIEWTRSSVPTIVLVRYFDLTY